MLFATGCQIAINRMKKNLLEIYSNDKNYFTLTGEVIEINFDNLNKIKMKCGELEEDSYIIFSDSNLDLNIGDVIDFTTVLSDDDDWLPIVAISRNSETILDFETGKENLIAWVHQLQYK